MARRGPARSDDHRLRAADREQQLAALRVRLQETAGWVRTAEDWHRCLRAAARLPEQSWANVLLISGRVPDATLVKGYEAWRRDRPHLRQPADLGRHRPARPARRHHRGRR
jgi:hypothetical protein